MGLWKTWVRGMKSRGRDASATAGDARRNGNVISSVDSNLLEDFSCCLTRASLPF